MGKFIRDYQIDKYLEDEEDTYQYNKKRKVKKFKDKNEY